MLTIEWRCTRYMAALNIHSDMIQNQQVSINHPLKIINQYWQEFIILYCNGINLMTSEYH